jgi:hypothetical protein
MRLGPSSLPHSEDRDTRAVNPFRLPVRRDGTWCCTETTSCGQTRAGAGWQVVDQGNQTASQINASNQLIQDGYPDTNDCYSGNAFSCVTPIGFQSWVPIVEPEMKSPSSRGLSGHWGLLTANVTRGVVKVSVQLIRKGRALFLYGTFAISRSVDGGRGAPSGWYQDRPRLHLLATQVGPQPSVLGLEGSCLNVG